MSTLIYIFLDTALTITIWTTQTIASGISYMMYGSPKSENEILQEEIQGLRNEILEMKKIITKEE